MDSPLITTIIPTYRRPELLRRALQSVLRQTYANFEVLVLDNASGDETAALVAEIAQHDARVKYYSHAENIGAEANFIFGMRAAQTPYFSLLSDDDVLLPEFFQTALDAFARFSDAIFFGGLVVQMTDTGDVIQVPLRTWTRDGYFAPPEGLFEMIRGAHPSMSGILFRREIVDVFGTFDPDITSADVDLLLRVAARLPIVISWKPCAIYMSHPASNSVRGELRYLVADVPKILDRMRGDTRIPGHVRKRAVATLTEYLRMATFRTGVRLVGTRHFSDAHKLASFLSDYYGQRHKGLTLTTLSRLCERVPGTQQGLGLVYRTWHRPSQKRAKQLEHEFGSLATYLSLGSPPGL